MKEPQISLKNFKFNSIEEIRECLFALSDSNYRSFQSALIPTVDKSCVIGVRIPLLRKLASEISKAGKANIIFEALPHKYYEEYQLFSL